MVTAVRSPPRTAPVLPRGGHILSDPRHGPLPPLLLLALTAVTGLVDAVSILQLGRVFVANMTGNVVFTGFANHGPALLRRLLAVAIMLVGAAAGAGLVLRISPAAALGLAAGLLALVTAGAAATACLDNSVPVPGARNGLLPSSTHRTALTGRLQPHPLEREHRPALASPGQALAGAVCHSICHSV